MADTAGMSEEDKMAAEWAAALEEAKPEVASEVGPSTESVAPATFSKFSPTGVTGAGGTSVTALTGPAKAELPQQERNDCTR